MATGAAINEVEGEGGARETDPQVWEVSMADALAQTGLAAEIAAISVGGQQHGLVVLDGSGRPLRKAPLWNDTRSAADARALVDSLGGPEECAKRVGSVLTSSFTVTHWAWLRRTEPETADAARRAMLPHDYLNFCLTGVAATDRSDASGTGWWSPAEEAYAPEVLALEAVQLDPSFLPEVVPPDGVAGLVSKDAAERFGLAAGVRVACGAGDNAAAALALSFAPGEAALSLGTSGTVYAPSAVPSADPTGTVAGFASADGRYLPLACTLNATVAIDRTSEWLGLSQGRRGAVGGNRFPSLAGGRAHSECSRCHRDDDRTALRDRQTRHFAGRLRGTGGHAARSYRLSRPVGASGRRCAFTSFGGRRPRSCVARDSAPPIRTPGARGRTERAGRLWCGGSGQCGTGREISRVGGAKLGRTARRYAPGCSA